MSGFRSERTLRAAAWAALSLRRLGGKMVLRPRAVGCSVFKGISARKRQDSCQDQNEGDYDCSAAH